jgi:hypothetical protein
MKSSNQWYELEEYRDGLWNSRPLFKAAITAQSSVNSYGELKREFSMEMNVRATQAGMPK